MIRGIGVDILEVERMRQAIERWGADFLSRVFTKKEIEYCNSKKERSQHFAARFAAKEAVSKALATGWSGGFRWKDVEIGNEPSGKPTVTVHENVKNLLAGSKIFLSLSHTKSTVVAFAVIERQSG
jgi:holo-[acyl-carrier protein] synthase